MGALQSSIEHFYETLTKPANKNNSNSVHEEINTKHDETNTNHEKDHEKDHEKNHKNELLKNSMTHEYIYTPPLHMATIKNLGNMEENTPETRSATQAAKKYLKYKMKYNQLKAIANKQI